jgi:hypothetical protein
MANGLKPFKIKPYIVWSFVIAILVLVIFASTRSNYQARDSMQEVVYAAPTINANPPPTGSLVVSPTETVPTQIPDDSPTPAVSAPPYLFPKPVDTMAEYVHDNLALQALDSMRMHAIRMVSLADADDSIYPASLDYMFSASENQGFMEASVDTLFNVSALTPPQLMTNEV